jgi:hypothetical protein
MMFDELWGHYRNDCGGTIALNENRIDARRTPGAKPAGLAGRSPLKGLNCIGGAQTLVAISDDEIACVLNRP